MRDGAAGRTRRSASGGPAMARPDCYQLSRKPATIYLWPSILTLYIGTEVWPQPACHDHGSAEVLSPDYNAACRNLEGRRREVGIP